MAVEFFYFASGMDLGRKREQAEGDIDSEMQIHDSSLKYSYQ
jgi:hypothetical protein